MSAAISAVTAALSQNGSAGIEYLSDNKTVAVVGGLGAVTAITYYLKKRSSAYNRTPSSFQLGTGNVSRKEVDDTVKAYYGEYSTLERGKGATWDKSKNVAELVDKFYSLVTDLYEWGWGQSFHFSPKLPAGRDWPVCEAAHEARIATAIGLAPGKTALDVGCGVGGPMRMVAAVSGGNVVGISINEYQIKRATYHNEKQGLVAQCKAVRGNFLDMPFEKESFDAAYAIEATCHAPTLEEVYSEVFRCLKPGSTFVAYEWVSTPQFDANNESHVAIMDEIIIGNGLPNMRTWKEAEQAGTNVGFDLISSRDLAINPDGTLNGWWFRLCKNAKVFRWFVQWPRAIVNTMVALRIAPKGFKEVHDMLVETAVAIIDGGEIGIFTPMHMLVFKKPETAAAAAAAAAPKAAAVSKAAPAVKAPAAKAAATKAAQ